MKKTIACILMLLLLLTACGSVEEAGSPETPTIHTNAAREEPAAEPAAVEVPIITEVIPEEPAEEAPVPEAPAVETPISEEPVEEAPEEEVPSPEELAEEPEGTAYILNNNTKKFHKPSCGSAKQIKDKNRADYTGIRDNLIAMGYSPCGNCHP